MESLTKKLAVACVISGMAISTAALAHETEEACQVDANYVFQGIEYLNKSGNKDAYAPVNHPASEDFLQCINDKIKEQIGGYTVSQEVNDFGNQYYHLKKDD